MKLNFPGEILNARMHQMPIDLTLQREIRPLSDLHPQHYGGNNQII